MSIERDMYKALNSSLACVETLKDLIDVAISFEKPVRIATPGYEERDHMYEPKKEYDKTYNSNSGVIAFQYEGVHYEIPYTTKVRNILVSEGFTAKEIGVILCNLTHPVKYSKYWESLLEARNAIDVYENLKRIEKSREEIKEFANKQELVPISDELLERCFKVPEEGFVIKHTQGEANPVVKKPEVVDLSSFKPVDMTKVGKISTFLGGGGYSGYYTFVYIDGYTYITQSKEVIRELKKNGFTESEDIKHLGIGWYEEIEDPRIREVYEDTVITDEMYYEQKKSGKKSSEERTIEYLKTVITNLVSENASLKQQISNSNENNNTYSV